MRNRLSPSPSIKSMSFFNRQKNCECDCHCPDDCENDYLAKSARDYNVCFSTSPMTQSIKTEFETVLCSCDKVCNCPCHCVSCLCCPCVKERQD